MDSCAKCDIDDVCHDCVEEHYLSGGQCPSCMDGCRFCRPIDGRLVCLECMEGYTINEESSCNYCPVDNCDYCDNGGICLLCSDRHILTDEGICVPCDTNCQMCGATSCLSCDYEYFLTAVNECTPCPDDRCKTCLDYDGTC